MSPQNHAYAGGNLQKINGRNVRARNPVLMSVQNNPNMSQDHGPSGGIGGSSHGHNVLNPLGNRSLSPANYQQLQSAMHQQQQMGSGEKGLIIGGNSSSGVSRKPASLGRKILGSGGPQSDQQSAGGAQHHSLGPHHRGQNLHSGGGHNNQRLGINSHHGGFGSLSPSNQYASRDRGSSHHGGTGGGYHHSHNFHPLQSDQ